MGKSSIGGLMAQGDVIVERLTAMEKSDKAKIPKALKEPVEAFITKHGELNAAAKEATNAEQKRDAALAAVSKSDAEKLDPSVDKLANALVGASLGKRQNPFAGFSNSAPGGIKEMAYADEVKAVRDLVEKVSKGETPAEVKRALGACASAAETVDADLKAYTLAQTAYSTALEARDKLLPEWARLLARLKVKAASEWADHVETYRATFAPPDVIRAPVARRSKKKKS